MNLSNLNHNKYSQKIQGVPKQKKLWNINRRNSNSIIIISIELSPEYIA